MGQSNSPSENYLFLNVIINFVIVNQKLTGSALHIEKNQTISISKERFLGKSQNIAFRSSIYNSHIKYIGAFSYLYTPAIFRRGRFSEDFFCEMPKKFSKTHVPGTEMTFIVVEKLVSIVFTHIMFCVTQAVTSLKNGQNLLI